MVRFITDLLACNQVENNHLCCRGSKNDWISSKSNLENYIQVYFTILGAKQIAIDCQNQQLKHFRSGEDLLEESSG